MEGVGVGSRVLRWLVGASLIMSDLVESGLGSEELHENGFHEDFSRTAEIVFI